MGIKERMVSDKDQTSLFIWPYYLPLPDNSCVFLPLAGIEGAIVNIWHFTGVKVLC